MSRQGRIEDIYPLSPMQEGMLFHTLFEPGGGAYVAQFSFDLVGELDVGAFPQAVKGLLERHAVLRTGFVWEGVKQPVQAVRRDVRTPFSLVDWRGLSEVEQEERMRAYLAEDRARGFDLARPPLMRFTLFRADETTHRLVLTFHQILFDGWSLPLVFRDIAVLYTAASANAPARLRPGRPYREYIAWLQRQDRSRVEAFWRETLEGFTDPTPVGTRTGAANGGASEHVSHPVSPERTARLQEMARGHGLTVNTLVQGAWALLLSRYSGEDDVAFGAVVSGRPAEIPGVEEMVGLFINTLPVRVRVPAGERVVPWLKALQQQNLAMRDYEHSPLVQVRKWCSVPAGRPLFESILSFNNYPVRESMGQGQRRLSVVSRGDHEHADHPFMLSATMQHGIVLDGDYQPARFEPGGAERILAHLETLLAGMAAGPERPLAALPLLTEAEQHRVLDASTGPRREVPGCCLHELFEARAALTPGAPAVRCQGEVLTYAELDARANRLAHLLHARGVRPESRVALCTGSAPEMAVAILGTLKAGAAYVPLDPDYPAERLAYLLRDCGAALVLAWPHLAARLPATGAEILTLEAEPPGGGEPLRSGVGPENAAYVIYTSGSTGLPKGVVVEHRSVVAYATELAGRLGLVPGDRFLQFASPGFDVVVEELFPAWAAGACVVFSAADLFSPEELGRVVAEEGVSALELPTAYWHEWVRELSEGGRRLPECVRFVIVGGERVSAERLREWVGQGTALVHVFGLTETTVTSATLELAAGEDGSMWENLPVGRPTGNTRLYVLDPAGHPAPVGVPGELYVGGAGVARGYLGRAELTARRFVPDALGGEAGARAYRTGDRVRWRGEGTLEFLGRMDEQVKVRGYRIEPGEIEAALLSHPAISGAVVVAPQGEGSDRRLVAYVVPSDGYVAAPGGLRRAGGVELWPSHGEYPVYDDLLYRAMADDVHRNRGYREALAAVMPGKVAVDVGTGGEVVLARMCVEAGARKVYAVELMEESYLQAQAKVRELGLEDRIVLLRGDAAEVELPEPVDVCVSELIGCIGGSEGAVAILGSARRWLKPDGVMVPGRCVTRIAAVRLPDEVHADPAFPELGGYYAERVFDAVGHPFDLPLCLRGFPGDHLHSGSAVFEELDFSGPCRPDFRREIELAVTRDGRIDGFLLWIQLHPGERLAVDSLEQECSWLPMFFPALYPGVEARAGDTLRLVCSAALSDDGVHPDYRVEGELRRGDGTATPFAYDAAHHRRPEELSPFHRRLFPDGRPRVRPDEGGRVSASELREHVGHMLPAYMVPSAFVVLERLPLTSNGKVDRRALPDPEASQLGGAAGYEAPRSTAEETLAAIWTEVLKRERVGVHDSFFDLGGDSILSIQVVSRARRAGLHLTPRHLFEHPTVAGLARICAAGEAVRVDQEQGTVSGAVELTPVQRWFFAQEIPERRRWNMAELFAVRRPLDLDVLERALALLLEHHDALRLRFHERDGVWRQESAPPGGASPLARVDLSGVPEAERRAALEREADRLQGSLSLEHGPLLRLGYFHLGGDRPRLLVAAHHLAMDNVSWGLLLEDLQSAYAQLSRGESPSLPEKTTSFQRWSARLAEHTRAGGFDAELPFWTDPARAEVAPLPVDFPGGRAENTEGSERSLGVALTAEETGALLAEVPRAYRTQINDVLLTALARAASAWTGEGRLLVNLEGHGREDLFADVDLSRTVGWFTSMFPVLLDVRGAAGEGAALKAVKEQLRAIPRRGIGYGALRYLGSEAARARLAALPEAELHFEYLGQTGGAGAGESGGAGLLGGAAERAGAEISPRARRTHLLSVSGGVSGGRLRLAWDYSEALHRRETVERLAEGFLAELRALIAHCTAPEAGGYTPSDFPLAGLEQAALDELLGGARDVEDVYPLVPMQEGMLFHTLYTPGGGAYIAQFSFDLEGELDEDAFARAWQGVMARHAALRTGFVWEGQERAMQVVRSRVELPLERRDWRGLEKAEQEERWEAYLREDRARGFDPQRAPLMRVALFRTAESRYLLVLTHHQMMLDGWSLPVVFTDVAALYLAESAGAAPPAQASRPYRDYIAWLQAQDVSRAEGFWRETLAGFAAAPPLGVRTGAAAAPEHTAAAGHVRRMLAPARTAALQEMARRQGLTVNTLVQGAWGLVLGRYGGGEDAAFGVVVSGRPAELPGLDETVGMFLNTLPVRVRLGAGQRVGPWLKALQEQNVSMREHEYTPLVQMQKWSEVPAGEPLFESILSFNNYPVEQSVGSGERSFRIRSRGDREQADLPLTLAATLGAGLDLEAEYLCARFSADAVERMLGHVEMVLGALAARPEGTLGEIPLLTEAERFQVLDASTGPRREVPGCCLHELFEARAALTPGAPAVRCQGEVLTYAELDARANRLAHLLHARGVRPESRVALCTGSAPEMAVAILGTLKAGAAYVPLDPDYPAERLAYLLRDCGAALVLARPHLAARLPATGAEIVCLEAEPPGGGEPLRSGVRPENAAYVIYTSGSTGLPKGVVVEHRSVVAYATELAGRLGLVPGDRFLQFASPGFDVVVEELFPAWAAGACVVFSPADLFSPEELGRVVAEEGVSALELPTAYWHEWVRELSEGGRLLPECVRFVIVGGERVSAERLREWVRQGTALVHVFGLTETTVTSATLELAAGEDGSAWENLPVGRPTGNTRLYVLDPAGHPAPVGVPGELYVGGAGVARGYLGRAELTARRFVPDALGGEAGARAYRTGDRVRWRGEGTLEFLGRMDEQVKVRGYRIEPGEIEAALLSHPGVREAVVVVREDAPGDRRLAAYVVAQGDPPSTAELREHLGERVPEYMVPSAFVTLDALPLTPNGKIDRRGLPAPDRQRGLDHAFVAPRTPAEVVLAEVWGGVLGVERVGVHDNFFELGGDSILSIQVVSRARKAGLHLTPRHVFEHPTVAGLARVATAGTAAVMDTQQGTVTGAVELTPVQRWFFAQEVPERRRWNMSELFSVRRLDPALLARALARLLEHHDALRLRFRERDGVWQQESAAPGGASPLARIDLAALTGEHQRAALERAADALQGSLCLERGPLLRLGYFHLGGDRPGRLLVAAHHLAMDEVSWGLLLEDLQAAYAQESRGEPVVLPEKTTSFQRWAARLAEHTSAGGFDAELPFWTDPARAEVAPLPVDFPGGRAENTEGSERSLGVALTAEETGALLAEVPRAYRTQINDVLLTALARAASAWTGEGRLLVNLEGHGREDLFADVDLSRTVGWFTSMFPVLLDVRGAAGEGAALKAVKEQLRAIPRRGIGYGALRYLGSEAARARLAALPEAELHFEYLGQTGGAGAGESGGAGLLGGAAERAGAEISPRARRTHLLSVSGGVSGGRLRLAWDYSEALHRRETVERLAEGFLAELRALIAHCTAPEAGGYTPSDFPLAGLEQAALDELLGGARDVEDVYPLVPMQEGMLFHTLYTPGGGAYIGQFSFDLIGELDEDAFARAWQGVTARHAALRTAFVWEGQERAMQVVHRRVELPLERRDWRGLEKAEQEERWEAYLREDRARGFDPQRAPLMRLALLRTAEDRRLLVWTHHQMMLDGWSLPLVFGDVAAIYNAITGGEEARLPPAPSYRDYVAWLQERDVAGAEHFWRGMLAGIHGPTPFGVDRVPDSDSHAEGGAGRARLRIPAERTTAVREGARRHGLTVNTLVQGAWALLLARYGGEDDVVFGTTVSGRPPELEVEETVGLFINTLPVRVRVSPQETVAASLAGVQERNVALREYEYTPIGRVQKWSEVPVGLPLFESVIVFDNYPVAPGMGQGRSALRVVQRAGREQGDLPVMLAAALGAELVVAAEYRAGRFDAATVERMLGHLGRIIESMAADPAQPLSRVEMMADAEREQVLAGWNPARGAHAPPALVHELFAAQARATPGAAALRSGSETITYAALEERSGRLAAYLRGRGVRPEVRVGICLPRGPELVVGVLAVLRAGGAYVPLDPAYPPERLAFSLADSAAPVLLTHPSVADRLPATAAEVVLLDGSDGWPAGEDAAPPPGSVGPESLAYVIYTSGSTGTPKGVCVEHRSLSATLLRAREAFPFGPGDEMPSLASVAFDIWLFEVLLPLLQGAAVRLVPAERVADMDALAAELADATLLHAVPALMRQVVEHADAPGGGPSRLRRAFVGGDAVPPDLLRRMRVVWPEAEVRVMYGPTEGTILCAASRVGAEDAARGQRMGRPLGNAALYVVDASGEPVPVGVPGELRLGGAGVARAYQGRPELTAERFVPDAFSTEPGARTYRTGDRVRWLPDGELEFLGRTDQQVKVRGFRIEPGEIEAALERHPGVLEAVAAVREDAPGERRLVAYLVPRGERAPSAAELREHLGTRLPEHMVPAVFVPVEAWPLTPNGKVDRRALPAPEGRPLPERAYVEPRTPTEVALAELWRGLLRVERVGARDSFFELGGDSILSIQLVARARKAGLYITPRQVFENPTVAELARVVGTGAAGKAEQGIVTGPVEPTPVQAWFLAQPVPERHRFNVSEMFRVRRPLDGAVLERAAARIVEHHDALRLRFRRTGAGWSQESAAPDGRPCVVRIDLGGIPGERRREALERAADQVQGSLELERGPLFRLGCFPCGAGEPDRLLVVAHHLVMDDVSRRVLLEDLQAAYARESGGEPVVLPAKTTSFRAWADRLAGHARSGGFDAELPYWTDPARAGVAPLPVDLPGGPGADTERSARSVSLALGAAETEALLRAAPAAYRTGVADVLLAALARAFAGWTGDGRLLLGLEGHGREELFEDVDLSRTVGWFTTVYPVLLDVRHAPGEGAAIKAVKEQLRAVPGRGIGYGALRHLGSEDARARLAALPEAQVGFNYLGRVDEPAGDPETEGEALLRLAPDPVGREVADDAPRRHAIEVEAAVRGGRLHLAWTYSAALHLPETVEALARRHLEELRGLVAHCTSAEAGGYTPSDFPLAGLTQARLDALAGSDRGIEDVYPLTPMQEGMLFHTLLEAGGGVFMGQFEYDLAGDLDVELFRQAWQAAAARHPVLRTGFVWEGVDTPLQVVRREVAVPLEREDWRELAPAEQAARRAAYLKRDRARGFEIGRAPLLRLALFRTADAVHHLVWTQHHLIVDGWSLPVLFRDVAASYTALSGGREARLPPVRPYRDYMAWLRRQDHAGAERFWRETLAGFGAPTPVSRGSAAGGHEGARRATLSLPEAATGAVQGLARELGLTVNTLVQGAWALLLSRFSGEDDVVFGSTVAGRPPELEGVEEMVGLFINTLPVRVRVAPGDRVAPWLAALQERNVAMREWEFSSLAKVQRWSDVPAGEPLFESVVVFDNYPVGKEMGSGDAALRVVGEDGVEEAGYPLLVGGVLSGGLTLYVEHEAGVFDGDEDAERTLHRLAGLLGWMAAHPEGPLDRAPLLTAAEREEVVSRWSAGPPASGPPVLVHERVSMAAARAPDAVAVQAGEARVVYAELERRANRLAGHLRALGVGPETRVGVCLERTPELIVALLGVLRAGGAYVPLDPAYPAERLAYMVADSGARVVVTSSAAAERLPAGEVLVVRVDADRDRIASRGDAPPELRLDPENASHVIYTSGSTGTPKGTVVRHASVAVLVDWLRGVVTDEERRGVLASTSVSFDVSVAEIFGTLCWGGRLVLVENALALAGIPESGGVRLATMVPTAAAELLRTGGIPRSVLAFNLAGEALPDELAQGLNALDHVRAVRNLYGPTEDTSYSTLAVVPPGGSRVLVGRPMAGTRAYVLDPVLEPLPAGVPGELYLAGDGVARGYLGRPELTAERFLPSPLGPAGSRMYRTGDRARWTPEGELEYLGRMDRQVKVRGFRIEPGEVEAGLRAHPAVRDAVATVRGDGGEPRLVGYVVAAEGAEAPGAAELRSFLRERFPEHMVPSLFVPLERLPLTPSGKLDRRALPGPEGAGAAREHVAPRTALEEVLAEIWKQVLGVERVGVHDSFFDLGGHSLLVTRAISRMREALLADIPLRVLFDAPTLGGLAEEVVRYEASPGDMERICAMLRMVAAMSADDVQRLLAARQSTGGPA